MSEYTHNDDVADMIYAKEQEIKLLKEALQRIERLRKLAHNLYEETKRCGSLHDTPATMDYEEWLEENE